MLKRLCFASVLVVLVFGVASGASAFTSDKRTLFTFSQPVALPGVTLPAGTYMFRLADPTTSRKVIQVTDTQGVQSYAMLLSLETRRNTPSPDPEIRFLETPAGAPMPVSAWWYAGESVGYQFIYPKDQLEALNRTASKFPGEASSGEPVPPIAEPASPGVVEGEGVPAEADVEAQVAQAEPPAAPAPAEPQAPASDSRIGAREELPETASPLALLLLSGATTAAFGLWMLRKS
jgi:hypothetical protein